MPAKVKLEAIIEALELAGDSTSSYLDLETGEVLTLTEEEFSYANDRAPRAQKAERLRCV